MATRPSLGELLEGVAPDKLDKPCKDGHLCDISLKVADWKFIAPFLHISEVVQREIESEGSVGTQRIAMLRRWKKKYGRRATYRKLATVFWKLERADLVDEVCCVLTDSDSSSSGEEEAPAVIDVHSSILDQYADHLRCKYRKEVPTFTQWPPPPTRKFFNLAMIHRTPIQLGPIDKEYIRLTQLGNVDDILLNKTAISLKDIFRVSTNLARRTIILVEGAPGAGKSTLAWYICDQWGSGNLFSEFKLVVFVQLRSSAVQSATSIASLLPRMLNGQEREVLSHLATRCGKDVLFVLDGWDEFSGGLAHDSICGKLIYWPGDLSMQESTLLITSRPVASGELQQYCTSRIEIIGFAPKEVKEYFKDALAVAHQGEQQAELLQECLMVRPVIQASCYLPLNAAIVVHLFITEGNTLPKTFRGLFTSLVLNCIVRHLKKTKQDTGKRIPKVTSFENIPKELQPHFNAICALAYHGIMTNKASFSEEELCSFHLSTESSAPLLSLIQGWSSFKSSWEELSYSFFHLSVQELLAALHISKQPHEQQMQVFKSLFGHNHFSAVLNFYAAFTKLEVVGIREFIKQMLPESTSGRIMLDCLYEAQDPMLCQYISTLMGQKLTLDYTLSPFHCMVLGYFLHCLCLTPGGGKFHIDLDTPDLDSTKCSYLINELKSCSHGQLMLSLDGSVKSRSLSVLVPMLQESCSHCISQLSVSLKGQGQISFLSVFHSPIVLETSENAQLEALAACLTTNSIVKKLSISNCKLQQREVEALADSLATNTTLETLSLSGCPLSVKSSETLAHSLALNTALVTLCLSECIPVAGLPPLAHSLARNSTLRFLDISGAMVSPEDILTLAHCLVRNSALETLNLSGCKQGVGGYASVIALPRTLPHDTLKSSSSTLQRERSLSNTEAENLGSDAVTSTPMATQTGLISPKLGSCTMTLNPSIQALAMSLGRHRTLKCLNISKCWITQEILPLLPMALAENNNLENLVLSWNCFDEADLDNVTETLRLSSGLKALDISGCGIGYSNPARLELLLTASQSLETLILSFNNLSYTHAGKTGAHYLAQGLKQTKSLRSLSIAGCRLTDHTMEVIAEALEQNPSLQELDFSRSHLSDRGLRYWTEVLNRVPSLRVVTPCFDASTEINT